MFIKYPKTFHIHERLCEGNKLEDLVDNLHASSTLILVIEEKMDGTQVGISFDESGNLQIQSRGAYVSSEQEFSLLKNWTWQHYAALSELLGNRYILFGEWLYAKHTMYYDLLPCYLLEFDMYDRDRKIFLSTKKRQQLLRRLDFLSSVRVIDTLDSDMGAISLELLRTLIDKSAFISKSAYSQLDDEELNRTDLTGFMEGLYLKVEDNSKVLARYKLVRPEFIQKIVESGSHWKDRKLVTNCLISN